MRAIKLFDFNINLNTDLIKNLDSNKLIVLGAVILLAASVVATWGFAVLITLILALLACAKLRAFYVRKKRERVVYKYSNLFSQYRHFSERFKKAKKEAENHSMLCKTEVYDNMYKSQYARDQTSRLIKERETIGEELKLLDEQASKIILREDYHKFSTPHFIIEHHEKGSFSYYLAIIEHKINFFDNKLRAFSELIKHPIYSN